MSNIVSMYANQSLSPETLHLLGTSYDHAAKILSSSAPLSSDEKEALASALLGFAKSGIKDADLLTLKAISTLQERRIGSADLSHAGS